MGDGIHEHVPGRIITIDNILSKNECNELIAAAEKVGFKPSPKSGGGHGQVVTTGARTSQFYVNDDLKLANKIWNLIKHAVPNNLHNIKPVPYMNSNTRGDEFTPIGINEHIRYYKYDIGQIILKHDDYRMSRYRYDPQEDKYYYQMTFLTVLIYLNEEFKDGRTMFWTKYANVGTTGHCRFIRDIEFAESDLQISPETGKVLINDHMVQHEGEAPAKGVKYILRTDIVHERAIDKKNINMKFKRNQTLSEWTRHYEPSCLHYTE